MGWRRAGSARTALLCRRRFRGMREDKSEHIRSSSLSPWSEHGLPARWQSKKQGCVSHSTPEAEIVAADHAMRTAGVPSLDLWERLLGRGVTLQFHEDNETCISAMRCGYSAAMRHLRRTHGVYNGSLINFKKSTTNSTMSALR